MKTPSKQPPSQASPAFGMLLGATAGFLVRDLAVESFASLWLVGAGVGLVLWMLGLRKLVVLATVALALGWSVVALTSVAAQLATGLIRREPPVKADAVFVFASRLQADGEPTPAALSQPASRSSQGGESSVCPTRRGRSRHQAPEID